MRSLKSFNELIEVIVSADATKALEIDAYFLEGYRARARAYEDSGAFDKALADYAKALELEPRESSIYLAREEFRLRKGQLDEAIGDYSRAIQKDFQFAWTFARRARLRHQKKEHERALKDIESALQLSPRDAEFIALRGDIRRDLELGSLQVYPIKDYGAMEIGRHRFCHKENGKDDCGTFGFAMVVSTIRRRRSIGFVRR